MIVITTIKMALKSLYANKLRSILAMLGIIIGVGSVIAMLAIATGARREVMERIELMGTNLIIVRPGQRGSSGVMTGTFQRLTVDDARAIVEQIPGVEQVSPVVQSTTQLRFYNKNTRTNVTGAAVTYFNIRNYPVEIGRPFNEIEVNNMARVAVIGSQTAEDLGFTEANIGEHIKIRNINFEVIGILKTRGESGWFNPDDQAMIPYTTAMNIVFGLDSLRQIDIQVASGTDMTKAEDDITNLLRRRHRIQPGFDDTFSVRNQAEWIAMADESNRTFTILLGSIASISLLVGGIGIMNIMLVTVTERTREIGVRKAIGAKDRDILSQFLIEALIMSGIGGLLGLAFGLGASEIIQRTTDFSTLVEPHSIALALSFAISIGIFFGYYPARRAAMLDPIQSLYYE